MVEGEEEVDDLIHKIDFKTVYLTSPVVTEKSTGEGEASAASNPQPLFPREARLRNLTYSTKLFCDIEVTKVDNKTGNLGNSVTVSMDKESIVVESKINFSKRYLKYLTKKYLKKQDLKEFLRVIASQKNTYQLRYFKIQNEEAAE